MTNNQKKLAPQQVELRRAREEARMTRSDLARLIDSSVRTIARWEIEPGRLDLDTYEQVMSSIRAKEVPMRGDTIDLSQVPSVELARELTRRLERLEQAQRQYRNQTEASIHTPER